jgi:hypothetical protein
MAARLTEFTIVGVHICLTRFDDLNRVAGPDGAIALALHSRRRRLSTRKRLALPFRLQILVAEDKPDCALWLARVLQLCEHTRGQVVFVRTCGGRDRGD